MKTIRGIIVIALALLLYAWLFPVIGAAMQNLYLPPQSRIGGSRIVLGFLFVTGLVAVLIVMGYREAFSRKSSESDVENRESDERGS